MGLYYGSSLSILALNVRKSPIGQVKFLHSTSASLSSRKKKHFLFNTYSRKTHVLATINTSQSIARSAIAVRQNFFQVQPRQKINFFVEPIVFFFFCLSHFEYYRVTECVTGFFDLISALTAALPLVS